MTRPLTSTQEDTQGRAHLAETLAQMEWLLGCGTGLLPRFKLQSRVAFMVCTDGECLFNPR